MSNFEDDSISPAGDVIGHDYANADLRSAPDETLTIANVARMFDVSRLTLRYYERRGLIKRRQRIGRVRVYTWADCNRIVFIINCRRVGLGSARSRRCSRRATSMRPPSPSGTAARNAWS